VTGFYAGKRVWVAGHTGLVGSALVRRLAREDCELIEAPRDLDLRLQEPTSSFVRHAKPDIVFMAAAKVGGIQANLNQPVAFLLDNLLIASNVISAASRCADKLVFLGSSCIYPKDARQPIVEDALLSGPLEPSNRPYAVAKIAGVELVRAARRQFGCDFICAMPCNLYGPNDKFDLEDSHVIPALIRKAHEAKVSGAESMVIWGTGAPRREFLHVDDCADALVYVAETYSDDRPINIGAGVDLPILRLARMIAGTVGFQGEIVADPSKPDGVMGKLLNVERLSRLGWRPTIGLREGLEMTYRWFLDQ